MTRLSVNINKIATLRNARGGGIPDVLKAAVDCERFGAQGITVHPRPDERHITRNDVYELKQVVKTEFNIEGYPTDGFLKMAGEVLPQQVTLVPDPPDVLTSSEGWDVFKHRIFLTEVISYLKKKGIRVSIFLEPDLKMVEAALETGTDRIELYTGPYAAAYKKSREAIVKPYAEASSLATKLGLGVNAGHDLNRMNLGYLKEQLPGLLEVSIGHELISDALYYGLENTIGMYLQILKENA